MVGNHRNCYHVLIHLGLYVRKYLLSTFILIPDFVQTNTIPHVQSDVTNLYNRLYTHLYHRHQYYHSPLTFTLFLTLHQLHLPPTLRKNIHYPTCITLQTIHSNKSLYKTTQRYLTYITIPHT